MAESDSKCTLILMVVLNFFIFLAGGAAFVSGMLLKFSSGIMESEVLTLLNNIKVDGTPVGTLADANVYMMIIGGVFVMVIGVLGLCGAWNNIKECLWAYIIIIVVLILLQIVVVALWIFMRQTGDEWFRGQLLEQLDNYEGPEATDDVSSGWNTLFMKARCCGVNSQYGSSSTTNDFRDRGSKWWNNNRGSDNIPGSCCKGATLTTVKNYIGSTKCPAAAVTPINYYTEGCYERITIIVKQYSLIMLVVVGVIFFVQVTAIVSAYSLVKKNKVDTSQRDLRFDQSRTHPSKKNHERF